MPPLATAILLAPCVSAGVMMVMLSAKAEDSHRGTLFLLIGWAFFAFVFYTLLRL